MTGPFSKVLVANRGEIACRVFRTLKRLGIASVAVYSQADKDSLHVRAADEAVCIGPAQASESYLSADKVLAAAKASGAQAIHPGYGFLSENAEFARACARAGIVFVGPSPENMEAFGLKHRARAAATAVGVPLLPGTGLLSSMEEGLQEANKIGWPVMLKSTGGGGGIGMRVCRDEAGFRDAWEATQALALRNFKDAGLYLERFVEHARHLEVQVFGDGKGGVAVLGDRDCSAQRRNQKVLEECPAPGLSEQLRLDLHDAARRLCSSQNYQSAGTVEFVYDTSRKVFSFLEVNTRLQVEHTVTEEVWGLDLVEWMLRQAWGDWSTAEAEELVPCGHAIQARLYAEDPGAGFRPGEGLLTRVVFPPKARVETWVESGTHVSTNYDPLLAKIIVHAPDRATATDGLVQALSVSRTDGVATNRAWLIQVLASTTWRSAATTTAFLAGFRAVEQSFEVLRAGTQTTVQDWPGRTGYWQVGIPPSGPMDDRSFRVGNLILGNPEGTPALECTLEGPWIKFRGNARVCLTGANMQAALDGKPVARYESLTVQAGQTLSLGMVQGGGQRAYIAFAGGIDVPEYLGSASTFTLGGFGGHGGRELHEGDVLAFAEVPGLDASQTKPLLARLASEALQADAFFAGQITTLRITVGPQGAPEHFKPSDIARFLDAQWEVHFNSSRTGVRLIGPSPDWPRTDGGEAGLHPSNIHDNPYVVGALDFTGDMPVILGPDGPSLGGFVCPFAVIRADLWKVGQLSPGARLRFVAVSLCEAREAYGLSARQNGKPEDSKYLSKQTPLWLEAVDGPVILEWVDKNSRRVLLRRGGDNAVLVELGEPVLDIGLRLSVQWWLEELEKMALPGVLELTPGIRSLQIIFDDDKTRWEELVALLQELGERCPALADIEVPSRTVWLPLSWDDPATQLAIRKYTSGVRPDAPWCPSNIEFIRRINGLPTTEDVKRIVFEAEYLVLGLGDVYLGAPVATPLDPRQRLVTTKYNPARTWTPENAVGIGGAYMCVYGMEGPGGYQFVGRTVQMWNRFHTVAGFEKPWLLRFFDRVRFYPVSAEELLRLRDDVPLGRQSIRIENGSFRWREYEAFLSKEADSIQAFRTIQHAAFEAERQRWKAAGLDTFHEEDNYVPEGDDVVPAGSRALNSVVSGSLWKLPAVAGTQVRQGDTVAILESMKMEIRVAADCDGEIVAVFRKEGEPVRRGQALVAIRPKELS